MRENCVSAETVRFGILIFFFTNRFCKTLISVALFTVCCIFEDVSSRWILLSDFIFSSLQDEAMLLLQHSLYL